MTFQTFVERIQLNTQDVSSLYKSENLVDWWVTPFMISSVGYNDYSWFFSIYDKLDTNFPKSFKILEKVHGYLGVIKYILVSNKDSDAVKCCFRVFEDDYRSVMKGGKVS